VKLRGEEQDMQAMALIVLFPWRADPIDRSFGSALSILARYLKMKFMVRYVDLVMLIDKLIS
jgi:hypothetical protein